MDLEREEAFECCIFRIIVGEVDAWGAVEPGFNVVAFATNHNHVPIVPLESRLALSRKCIAGVGVSLFWKQLVPAGFIVQSARPAPFVILVMLALIAEHATVGINLAVSLGPLIRTKHQSRIASPIKELELANKNEIPIGGFGSQKRIGVYVFAETENGLVVDPVLAVAINRFPSGQIRAIKQRDKPIGFEYGKFDRFWQTGRKLSIDKLGIYCKHNYRERDPGTRLEGIHEKRQLQLGTRNNETLRPMCGSRIAR